ncbi:MAG TPA: 4Fe-4S dicluster domain-containing protein [Coriobacteriia bacterium]
MFGSGLAKGLGITLRRLFRHPVTELYPFEHKDPPECSRTFLAMRVNEEGAPACRACNTCIVGCPDRALRLVRHPEDNRRALGFVVNSGRCTFCGLCVENCPYDALYFTQDYERATSDKGRLIYHLIEDGVCTHEGEVTSK